MKEIILLTGGSGGIGRAICQDLTQKGFIVYNVDKVQTDLMVDEFFFQMDLCNFKELFSFAQNISKDNIIGFVHCAGFGGPFISLNEIEESLWDQIFGVNVKSPYIFLKYLLPKWKEKHYGRFIGIGSSLAIVGAKFSTVYASSKHALLGLVRSLADEWGEYGITCNLVSPGYVHTNMGVQEDKIVGHLQQILNKTPSKKIAAPHEIARVVSFLLDKDSSYINGANWVIDGGITAV